ncbi:hypothetical protein AN642_00525 [Epulopiscium sp. SCG-B10WGA-EpuloA2]|nr:hypothetical protein AN642_00480 [Epulopiscium sp. SCG-B10WGA-EpuloA2]ONI46648.1 hypothetical protein AN642_00525 [Epulopiscium sp. SCG-B10WGA-EpuloA2]
MKKLFNNKIIKISVMLLVFIITFILLHFTSLNELHGRSDAPLIIGIVGCVGLIISYIFNLNIMTIATTLGYGLSIVVGMIFESEGMIFNNKSIHTMWIVWLVSYCIIIMLGLMCDFLYRAKAKKSKLNLIGAFASLMIIVIIIFSYATKPLTVNDVFAHKPQFYGVVTEIYKNSMLLSVDENSFVANSGDMILVSIDVAMSDLTVNKDDFTVGDIVKVYFDGSIAESDPLGAGVIYAISNIDVFICEDGIKKNGDLYPYDEISVLTGLPISDLKEYSTNNPSQFIMDFLNHLRNLKK